MGGERRTLRQERMIERVRELCRQDERLVAAAMYGSFVQGEGDEYSDIEFLLYFDNEAFASVDRERWVAEVAPVEMFYVNEYGVATAVFDTLIRGEFHFDRASDISGVGEGVDNPLYELDPIPELDRALILDRTDEFSWRLQTTVGPPPARDRPEDLLVLGRSFVNWFLFGSNLLARGEIARALDLLGIVRNQLLRMVRVQEEATAHWFNPSKLLEREISERSYARYVRCTARADADELRAAYRSAGEWSRELMQELGGRHGVAFPIALLDRIRERDGPNR